MKQPFSVFIQPETYEFIRNNAESKRSYGAYLDKLIQKEKLKSITLEDVNKKLDNLIKAIQNSEG